MKIWISPYQVSYANVGFLIKIQSKEFQNGYADCRPWNIFNDATVDQQIQRLKERKLNSLLKRSIFFAHIDGVAREEKRSLWSPKTRLRSHYTLFDFESLRGEDFLLEVREKGFRTLKLKVGRDLNKEVPVCLTLAEKKLFRLRLDFNGVDAEPFLKKMSSLFLSQVDLIEDPGLYSESRWRNLENTYGVRIALDQALDQAPNQPNMEERKDSIGRTFPKIIKPARENNLARTQDVITNSLDHPVGQAFAALQAQESVHRLGRQPRDYGLQSAHLFQRTPYFEQMSTNSAYFLPIPGTGIGFDNLLEEEPWTGL